MARFRHSVQRVFDQQILAIRIQALFGPLISFLPNLGLAAILLVGGREVIHGSLTVGQFTAFYAYLLMLISPMRTLGYMLSAAQRATASGTRIFQILDREPEITTPAAGARASGRPGAGLAVRRRSHLRGLSARRAPRRRARDPSRPDDRAGRSDGFRQVGARVAAPRLYDVTAGSVTIDGADVRSVDLVSLRRAIAVVNDDPFLFSASIHDNIAYARPEATREEVQPAAARRPGRRIHRRRCPMATTPSWASAG